MAQSASIEKHEPSHLPRHRNPLLRLALLIGGVLATIILGGAAIALIAGKSDEVITTKDPHTALVIANAIASIDVPSNFKPWQARTVKGMYFAADAVLWTADNDDWLALGKIAQPYDAIAFPVDEAIAQLPLKQVQNTWFYGHSSETQDVEINGVTATFEIQDAGMYSPTSEFNRIVKGVFPTNDGQTAVIIGEFSETSLSREQITNLLDSIK